MSEKNLCLGPLPLTILVKLGSIVVHVEEMLSPDGHDFDRQAILSGLSDPEVREWLAAMDALALLPVKRRTAE